MKNNKGFTLIELLAVIVVLAIIMVIAGTSIIGTINQNRADSFVSTARVVYNTLKSCAASEASGENCRKMVDYDKNQYSLTILKDEHYNNAGAAEDADGYYSYKLTVIKKGDSLDDGGGTAASDGKFANVDLSKYYGGCAFSSNAYSNATEVNKAGNAGATFCGKTTIFGEYKYDE